MQLRTISKLPNENFGASKIGQILFSGLTSNEAFQKEIWIKCSHAAFHGEFQSFVLVFNWYILPNHTIPLNHFATLALCSFFSLNICGLNLKTFGADFSRLWSWDHISIFSRSEMGKKNWYLIKSFALHWWKFQENVKQKLMSF